MSRACCDRRDCPWPSRPPRSCTRPPWSCRTTDPTDSDRPSTPSSPTPCPVHRRAPPPGSRAVPYAVAAGGAGARSRCSRWWRGLPRCRSRRLLTPAPHCPPQHRHPSSRQPPQRWPPYRFHRVRYRTRARHAVKSFRPYKLPDYSCQQMHSRQEGAATPLTPDRTIQEAYFRIFIEPPSLSQPCMNRCASPSSAPTASPECTCPLGVR